MNIFAGIFPGALHLDLFGLSLIDTRKETFDTFMWMMAYLFQQRGLDPTKPIVWYEDISGTRASRGLWFCEYLGHSEYAFTRWRFQSVARSRRTDQYTR